MPPRTRAARRGLLGAVVVAGILATPAFTAGAGATSDWPSPPVNVHPSALGVSTIVITANPASNVTGYRVYVSPVENDLWGSGFVHPTSSRRTVSSRTPAVSVTGLPYITTPYYYRYETVHGSNVASSGILTTHLRPATPNAQVTATSHSLYVTWSSWPATSIDVEQSLDPAGTVGVRVYAIGTMASQLTPYDLNFGTQYYFRVRAVNGATVSGWSSPVSGTYSAHQQVIREMSYNLLTLTNDGKPEGDGTIASWPSRLAAMVPMIKRANPDVIAVQEAGAQAFGWMHPRQVDDLAKALGSQYTVAHTEALDGQPNHTVVGDYIIYRNTTYEAVGAGGNFDVAAAGSGYAAAYQVLRNRSSGITFMAVSTHLEAGTGAAYSAARAAQTSELIDGADRVSGGVPILFAGDFASAPASWQADDSPGRLMRTTAQASDAYWTAPAVNNSQYNSFNGYLRTAPLGGLMIDRIFGTPGIAMHYWSQLLTLSGGRFVGVIPSDHNPVYADMTIEG